MSNFIVPLSAPEAVDAERFGPKAANQAALGQAGLPIPDGFCLDAAAYVLQLKESGLEEAARGAAAADRPDAYRMAGEVKLGLFENPIVPAVLEPLLEEIAEKKVVHDELRELRDANRKLAARIRELESVETPD